MSRKLKLKGGLLRGGEALAEKKSVMKQFDGSEPDMYVDPRYYPFKSHLKDNVSTERAEYVVIDAKNLSSNILEWEADPQSSGHIDLENSYIVPRIQILANGAAIDAGVADQKACFEVLSSMLLFSQGKTYLNNFDCSDQHDGGTYPYAQLAKALLTEKDVPLVVGTVSESGTTTNIISNDGRAIYEDVYDLPYMNIDTSLASGNPILNAKFNAMVDGGTRLNGVQFVVRPRDAVWKTKTFLPPSTQLRYQLTKNDVLKQIRKPSGSTVTFTLNYLDAKLYLRRVYPNEQTIESINTLALSVPRIYPLLRGNTTYFSVPSGSSGYDKVGLLAGSRPSCLIVQHVLASSFNGSGTANPFSSGNGGDVPAIDVGALYTRVGGIRYPQNYDLGTVNRALFCNANNWVEYTRMTEEVNGKVDKKGMYNPACRSLNVWFINTRKNNENVFNKEDDNTDMDAVELHCRFNASLTSDVICIVTALSYDELTIDPYGKVSIN